MYHSIKTARKRKRWALKWEIGGLLVCILLCGVYLWQERGEDLPVEESWIVPMCPASQVQRQEVYTEILEPTVVYQSNQDMPEGSLQILRPGEAGELLCTDLVEYHNGVEAGRRPLNTELVRPPQDQVAVQGSGEPSDVQITWGRIRLPDGRNLTYTHAATIHAGAYPQPAGSYPLTCTEGTQLRIGVAAVNPDFIAPGTRLFITASDGSCTYGLARAIDGGLPGQQMELYFPTAAQCLEFGERTCDVYFLG